MIKISFENWISWLITMIWIMQSSFKNYVDQLIHLKIWIVQIGFENIKQLTEKIRILQTIFQMKMTKWFNKLELLRLVLWTWPINSLKRSELLYSYGMTRG